MFSYYLCMPSSKAYKSGIKPLKNGKDRKKTLSLLTQAILL